MESYLKSKLEKTDFDPEILLGSVKLLDEGSKETAAFKDSKYFPFYYHLGSQIKPKNVIQIGPKLGLVGACFLQSCKTVENWLIKDAFGEPIPFIRSNLRKFAPKNCLIEFGENDIKADLALFTEPCPKARFADFLNVLWDSLDSEGILLVDCLFEEFVEHKFTEFCSIKNREPVIFNTRYKVGIVTK